MQGLKGGESALSLAMFYPLMKDGVSLPMQVKFAPRAQNVWHGFGTDTCLENKQVDRQEVGEGVCGRG